MIFDEPTVGVDVGAKAEIYKLIEQLTRQGKCIILISSYLPEIMGLADEMMVISEGKLMGTLDRSEFMKDGKPVSYTHLDVYKRQMASWMRNVLSGWHPVFPNKAQPSVIWRAAV